MKYMISWCERPQGSPIEYENAQKRILEVFGQWKAPGNFKIDFFVIRVGEWGGHMLMEWDDPVTYTNSAQCFRRSCSRYTRSFRWRKPFGGSSRSSRGATG